MRARGDLHVFHEPFMYHYYMSSVGGGFAGFEPDPGHPTSFAGIRDMIRAQAARGPVFFKDMGYYVSGALMRDPGFAREIAHAVLIRDPAEAVVSYAKKQRDFTREEVGLEALWTLYQGLRAMGCDCAVLQADQVRADPRDQMARYWQRAGLADAPQALRWDSGVPEQWRSVETWHAEVLATTGIQPADPGRDVAAELAALGAPYTDYVAHHRPFYELLRGAAQA